MAEYYTVLRRAVGGIDPNVPETRRAVYDKARNALIGQLKAVDPPLTTAEISRQRLELEEAIRRVEREAAAGVSGPPLPAEPAPNRAPQQRQAPPQPATSLPPVHDYEAPNPSPQDVFRRAIQEAGMRGAESAERMGGTPARADATRYEGTAPDLRSPPPRERAPPPEQTRRAENPDRRAALPVRADATRYSNPPEYRQRAPAPDAARAPPPPEQYDPEPRLAPEYDQDYERQTAAPPSPQVDRRDRPVSGAPQGRNRGYLDESDRELVDRPARRSRLPGILLFVLIIAVVGGLGALAWSQRSVITDLLASFESGPGETKPTAAAETPVEDPAATGKNTDRLLPGEEPAANRDVRVLDAAPAPGETAESGDAAMAPEPLPASADATGDALVAQKAILYEEPVAGAGGANGEVKAINAAVTWRFVEAGPNGPEVEASLQVPERNMTIRFTLHKNSDDTLPASHLVEVVVDTPADFPGQAIGSIPRIVLKPTEEERGQPLVGAAAKVADGFFWIALSAAEPDIASNLSLIRERNWIDLPFVYENGQRAILTFEKGTPGERVFEKALAAWSTPG
jgi:hypothetical protein